MSEKDINFRTTISFHAAAVSAIDGQTEALLRRVTLLRSKRAYHLSTIKYYKGLATLARRVLPEILVSIFQICVDLGYPRTPFIASEVCSEWRQAALAPTLWSRIVVDPNSDDRDIYNRVKFILNRAKCAPLSVSLTFSHSAEFSNIMKLLMRQSLQWASLFIETNSAADMNSLLTQLGHGSFPQLTKVGVKVHYAQGEVPLANPPALSRAFSDALRLKSLDLFDFFPLHDLSHGTITSLNLTTTYTSAHPRYQVAVLRLLSQLPMLQTLSLSPDAAIFGQGIATEDDSVSLPQLNFLDMTGDARMFSLLPFIQTERLRCLHLRIKPSTSEDDEVDERTAERLRSFINSQGLSLELLELHGFVLPPNDIVSYFPNLPNLVELHLHDIDISDDAIYLLSGPNVQCPKLSKLDFRWCGQVTGKALVALARSRRLEGIHPGNNGSFAKMQIPSPIEEITLIHCSFVGEQDVLALASLTVCRLISKPDDYCRGAGTNCCQNEQYRHRIRLRQMYGNREQKLRRRLIL